MITKTCSKCGRELPASEFNKNNQAKDGLQCRCKECQKEDRKQKSDRIKRLLGGVEKGLSVYSPRELMEELYKRGYRGTLEYTEVHKIDISNF